MSNFVRSECLCHSGNFKRMFVRYAIYIYIFHIAWRNMFLFFLQNLVREINILADKVTNILHMYILYIYIYIYIYKI